MKAGELAQRLARDAERVAKELLPGGKRAGAEWKAGSTAGDAGDSLSVRLTGDKAGIWKDFAEGESGDLLDLWMACRGLPLPEAMQAAASFIGVTLPKAERKPHRKPERPANVGSAGGAVMDWLTQTRKLSPEAIAAYKVAGSRDGKHVVFPFLRDGELCNLKHRAIADKRDMRTEKGCEQMLFGWQAMPANARAAVICEGELDALALWDYGYPALSVFSGAGNLAWVENEFDALARFDDVFLCLDNDEAGQKGTAQLVERLGRERCRIVRLPKKDANDCLIAGIPKAEIDAAFAAAECIPPERLKDAGAFLADVLHLFHPASGDPLGVMLPWPRLMQKVQLRPSEFSVWTGISGHGKSVMLGQAMLAAAEQGERICIASLEMKPGRTLQRMIRQALGKHDPTTDEIGRTVAWLAGRVWLYDFIGEVEVDRVLDVFAYARKRYGVTQFVVDNLMMLDASEEDLDRQTRVIKKLMAFKSEYECHVHLVAHSRKGQDESRAPRKLDVKGSGNIVNQADNLFSVWRNKPKEEKGGAPTDPDAILFVDKQRNGDWEGAVDLWFDRPTMIYRDAVGAKHAPVPCAKHAPVPCAKDAAAGELVDF
jgi:twinkle protein